MYLCALYLSLSAVLFVAADPRYLGVDLHAHTLALSISVSPLPCLSFSPLKRRCAAVIIIIEIQDSIVFGCSHFIGSLYSSMVAPIGMKSLRQD